MAFQLYTLSENQSRAVHRVAPEAELLKPLLDKVSEDDNSFWKRQA